MNKKPPIPPLEPDTLRLLPDQGSHPRCAPFARDLGLDPGGTAIPAQRIIVVDAPLPWPKPVWKHALLSEIMPKVAGPRGPVRVLANVAPADGPRLVRTFFRDGGATVRVDHDISAKPTPGELGALVSALSQTEDPRDVPGGLIVDSEAVLICTQGSHDVCCGTDGVRLANELDHEPSLAGTDILRVSHTGGHRFAPTVVTFPGGRMWADADRQLVLQVLNHTGSPADVADRCRGWWGAVSASAQIAEREVFAHQSWAWEESDRTVTGEDFAAMEPGAMCEVRVESDAIDEPAVVHVTVSRQVPTITCRAEGGLPAKPGWELRASIH